ncbi:hypothetical protein BD779DRAFT_1528462 [Infundibulicybe gibba]|nr:hypothetical protein BD779DRAFT_1528462 [Infundibulicybe gibba]
MYALGNQNLSNKPQAPPEPGRRMVSHHTKVPNLTVPMHQVYHVEGQKGEYSQSHTLPPLDRPAPVRHLDVVHDRTSAPPSQFQEMVPHEVLYYSGDNSGHAKSVDGNQPRPLSSQLKRLPVIDTLDAGLSRSGENPVGCVTATTSSPEQSIDSEIWSPTSKDSSPPARKVRRDKPRIELAPDQPPTTQGKPRTRVYVACLQCRTRKIRCDGAKPVCHNCGRRNNGSECNYDRVPKRRGPDKTPGARQRMARATKDEESGVFPIRRRRRRPNTSDILHQEPKTAGTNDTSSQSPPFETNFHPDVPLSPASLGEGIPSLGPTFINPVTSLTSTRDRNGGEVLSLGHGDAYGVAEPVAEPSPSYGRFNGLSAVNTLGSSYVREVDEDGHEIREEIEDVSNEPSLVFTRKIWWDSLLALYSSPTSDRLPVLTASQRETTAQAVISDLRFLFRVSNYWFSFFHVPSFFSNFFDPTRRERIQPSLVLALLAMATFWQSSEVGFGRHGREKALRLRDEAQSSLEASLNAGWIDETLAQAAWLLALFEVCAHPRHSSERTTSSLILLDSIIRSLSLTFVDADDPSASTFLPGSVPAITARPQRSDVWFPSEQLNSNDLAYGTGSSSVREPASPLPQNGAGCSCMSLTLGEHWAHAHEYTPLWMSTPAWQASGSEADIRKESCRRLCWSSMILAAGHISYTTAHKSHVLDLFITDPANYALLFSGESVARSPWSVGHSSKDTIWALHDRSFMLWHGCIRMRNNTASTDSEKAHFAVKAWLEADALESTLNGHTCSIERTFIFQAREYIFNTRMFISHEFQRYIPLVTANVSGLFHRTKAEEWLNHQATVAHRFMYGLHTITGNSSNLLARRPFFVFWFMAQVTRALSLWQFDNTLIIALDVCKALLPPIDYLTALWPCSEQRYRYERLRVRLEAACYAAGVSPPRPPDLTLPVPSSPETLI